MSTSYGSVGVKVKVPVLGTVVGTRTLKEIAAGTPPRPPVEKPAVTVRDLSPSALASLKAAASPTPTPAKTSGSAAASTGSSLPARPVSVTPKVEDKDAAASKLYQLGESYLRARMKSVAVSKFKTIIKKYPGTEAAEKAQAKLTTLGA